MSIITSSPQSVVAKDAPMYMNGIGIRKRTSELNDDLFACTPLAIAGSWGLLAGGFIAIDASFGGYFVQWYWLVSTAISGMAGLCLLALWFKALVAVESHRSNVERETARRGQGWAKS